MASLLERLVVGRESCPFLLFEAALPSPSLFWPALLEARASDSPITLLLASHRSRRLLSASSSSSSMRVIDIGQLLALPPESLLKASLPLLFPDGGARRIFLDSADLLLFHFGAHLTARWSLVLRQHPACCGLVANHHMDAHSEDSSALLKTYASSVVRSGPVGPDGSVRCTVRHRKATGRLDRSTDIVQLSKELKMLSVRPAGEAPVAEAAAEAGPAGDLDHVTFDLRLSADERAERSSVRLPYVLSYEEKEAITSGRSAGSGSIHYEADEFDDLDEEDPDDDLNI